MKSESHRCDQFFQCLFLAIHASLPNFGTVPASRAISSFVSVALIAMEVFDAGKLQVIVTYEGMLFGRILAQSSISVAS